MQSNPLSRTRPTFYTSHSICKTDPEVGNAKKTGEVEVETQSDGEYDALVNAMNDRHHAYDYNGTVPLIQLDPEVAQAHILNRLHAYAKYNLANTCRALEERLANIPHIPHLHENKAVQALLSSDLTREQIFEKYPEHRAERIPCDKQGRKFLRDKELGGPITNGQLMRGETTVEELLATRDAKWESITSNPPEYKDTGDGYNNYYDEADMDVALHNPCLKRYLIDGSLTLENAALLCRRSGLMSRSCKDPINNGSTFWRERYEPLEDWLDRGILTFDAIIKTLKLCSESNDMFLRRLRIAQVEEPLLLGKLISFNDLWGLSDTARAILNHLSQGIQKGYVTVAEIRELSNEDLSLFEDNLNLRSSHYSFQKGFAEEYWDEINEGRMKLRTVLDQIVPPKQSKEKTSNCIVS